MDHRLDERPAPAAAHEQLHTDPVTNFSLQHMLHEASLQKTGFSG